MSSRKSHLRAFGLGRLMKAFLAAAVLIAPAIVQAQVPSTPLPTVRTTGTRRPLSLDEAVRIAEAQREAVRIASAGFHRAEAH